MRLRIAAVIIFALGIVSLPFLLAAMAAGQDHIFSGFLLNPIDANTYLAKMYQGWRGEWRFTLPFTAQPGEGAYLFVFYIFLGHFARWTGLELVLVFHLARLLSVLFMLAVLARFLTQFLVEGRSTLYLFVLATFGGGLGWLVFPFGYLTSDFWVAEAFPFLSAYANPHFPLGLGLILCLFLWVKTAKTTNSRSWLLHGLLVALVALLMAVVTPFGVVVVLVVLGGSALWEFWDQREHYLSRGGPKILTFYEIRHNIIMIAWIIVGGGPLLVYDFLVASLDPVLSGWNAQNLTPSPPVWDLIVSFSPVLLAAVVGAWFVVRQNEQKGRLLLVWAALGIVLLYLPFGLQRRFMMGLYVPLAGLAGFGLMHLGNKKWVKGLLLGLSIPTNLLVLLIGFFGVRTLDPIYYLSRAEVQAFNWIESNTIPGSLVLAAPDTGLFIPGHTGRRVIYGHPFETVNAEAEKDAVISFFENAGVDYVSEFLLSRQVDYVFYGERERVFGDLPDTGLLSLVYDTAGVQIYHVVVP